MKKYCVSERDHCPIPCAEPRWQTTVGYHKDQSTSSYHREHNCRSHFSASEIEMPSSISALVQPWWAAYF
ncbi:hypothetical protein E2C01_032586 [Portunus trituberculatus]|uniref:Uncharacterized protein n=1 Tax=Portunus trituberculatus TaxID=210409 RepID=A0A5B7F0N3_PORTR|nr:hypothetical protein [Portunus trituberculatus]